MARALYMRGLLVLHATTGDRDYLRASDELRELLAHDVTDRPAAWGLGFSWSGAGSDTAYTVTTALVTSALAADCTITGRDDAADLLERACHWLTVEVPWRVVGRGAAPWYAPAIPYVLPNVAALVAAALAEAYAVTRDARLLAPLQQATAFTLDQEHPAGLWLYGYAGRRTDGNIRLPNVIDALHSAYVLEGLLTVAAAGAGEADLLEPIRRGLDAYADVLVDADGRLLEKAVFSRLDDEPTKRLRSPRRGEQRRLGGTAALTRLPPESRCWGYGAAVMMTARAQALGLSCPRRLERLLERVVGTHLSSPDGRFPYLPNDRRAFPRHESHLFDGMAARYALLVADRRQDAGRVAGRSPWQI